jgi:hypothetical protein
MICWDHYGFERDITVYHVGGEMHFVDIRNINDGALIEQKRFRGIGARPRAIAYANAAKLKAEEDHLIAMTCFHCGDPAMPSTHGTDPRCERHYDV